MNIETSEQIALTIDDQGLDLKQIRADFPMLQTKVEGKTLIYFDTAATNHKPQVVIDKLTELYTEKYAKILENHTFSEMMTEAFDSTRSKVAKFIGAKQPEEIVFTTGSTQGINIIANGFGRAILKEGDEVLITMLEHHSNIIPWQLACQISGAKLIVVPINSIGEVEIPQIEKLLSPRTRIIAITHSSNALGTMLPVKEIVQLAHQQNIPVLVDGAQTAPHMTLSMQDLDCDFYAFSAHKMGGPAGIGILYGKAEWLDKLPPQLAGEGMADQVDFEESNYSPVPKKFEAGTPAFEEIVAFGTLLDYLKKLDMSKTAAYEQELMRYLTGKLKNIPQVKVYGTSAQKEPVVSFAIEGKDVKELEKYLNDKYNIAVRAGKLSAQPLMKHLALEALLRVSLCYYNTGDEIDLLVAAIKEFIDR
jgi:cysteine desulfurase/selenocysteine lyase